MITIIILVNLGLTAYSQDVSQWRGPDRTGEYKESGLLKKWPEAGPRMIWHFDGLGEGYGSAAVTSAGVFITGLENGKGMYMPLTTKR